MESQRTISLDFSPVWQEAIVGHMLRSYPFFIKCHMHLRPEWFIDPSLAAVVKSAFELYDSLDIKRHITIQEVIGVLYKSNPMPSYQANTLALLKKCAISAQSVGLDVLQQNMTTWIRLIKFRDAMYHAEYLHNRKDYEQARIWLQSTLTDINQISFTADDIIDFHDPQQLIVQKNQQYENCLTTGAPALDELLLKSSTNLTCEKDPNRLETFTKGSLVPGDTTILMGASNAGKTSALITIITANIRLFKNVLYITHEQKPEDISWRLYQCMTGLTNAELLTAYQNNLDNKLKMTRASEFFMQYLTYLPYIKPGEMWVEYVLGRIRSLQEARIAKYGKGYDLLAVDYPAKLGALKYNNKRVASWEEQIFVYDQFVNLARHYNMHAILPVQTNRSGFRINRDDKERMLDQDDIGGAYGIMQLADNVITLNRSDADIRNQTIMFHVAKCRSDGERHGTFVSTTKLQCCRTHGLDLHNMKYGPASTISKHLMREQLLQEIELYQPRSDSNINANKSDTSQNTPQVVDMNVQHIFKQTPSNNPTNNNPS